jgi:CubicO group peptidase (beta-lactamase class C family)
MVDVEPDGAVRSRRAGPHIIRSLEELMRLRGRVLVLFVAASLATLTAQSPSLTAALADLDAYASREYTADPVGGLMVGVVADGALAWHKAYGFADTDAQRVPTDLTPYRVGSITKQFVGLTLLQLVERGKARLSDPLVKYVPEFSVVKSPYPDAPAITLLQLATMTSGLAREPSGPIATSATRCSASRSVARQGSRSRRTCAIRSCSRSG